MGIPDFFSGLLKGSVGFDGNASGTFVSNTKDQDSQNALPPSTQHSEKTGYDATGRIIRDESPPTPERKLEAPGIKTDEEYLDKVENVYRWYVKIGKTEGLNDAANNLEHFLEGSGKTKKLSRKEARSKLFVRNGEEANRKRFAEGFTNKKDIGSKFLSLKDGETIHIKDNWDYKVGNFPIKTMIENADLSRSHLLRGDLNEALSTGTSFVKSNGDFKAKRQGNRISIDGVVTHQWEDKYDFSPAQSGGAGATVLEKAGRAKSFDIKSNWKQRVTGTLQIKNGKLVNPQLTWEDIESKKEK